MTNPIALLSLLVILVSPTLAQIDKADSRMSSGLLEALRVGTENAVKVTGTTDGFFANPAIKILLPEKLRTAEKGLRMAGMGSKIDEFELSMNRAAETAAPAAKSIFKDVLSQMSFDDARKILTGGNTAATEYFKSHTSRELTAAFKPSVESAMANTGVVKEYKQLAGAMPSLPFGRSQSFDISDYVVGKTLEGIFYMLGEEEKKIRTDPAAQVTPLLKQVFGKR